MEQSRFGNCLTQLSTECSSSVVDRGENSGVVEGAKQKYTDFLGVGTEQ